VRNGAFANPIFRRRRRQPRERLLALIWLASEASEWENRLESLPL
jgi:hypothetical protein